MQILRVLLAAVSCLLLGAHFLRSGGLLIALLVAALPLLLVVPRGWAQRALQVALALGALEWLRALARLVEVRRALGLPSARLAAILIAVAAITALAAVLLNGWRRSGSSAPALAAAETP